MNGLLHTFAKAQIENFPHPMTKTITPIAFIIFSIPFSVSGQFSTDTARVHSLLEASISAEGDTVFAILQEAQDLAHKAQYYKGEANALMYTGIEREEISDFAGAVPLYLEALDIYSKLGDSLGIAKCYTNLGSAFHRQNDTPKSIEYWELARPLLHRHGQPRHIITLLSNLAGAYTSTKEYEKSLATADTAFQMAVRLQDTLNMANLLNNMGNTHVKLQRWEVALNHYQQSLRLYELWGDAGNYCRSLSNIAEVLNHTSRHQEAYQLLNADSATCLNESLVIQGLFLASLADAAKGVGHYKEALQFVLRTKVIDDSIYNAERTQIIRETEGKYQNELLKKEKAIQQTQLDSQRTALWLVLSGLLLLLLLAWSVWRGKRRSDGLLANILPRDTIKELKSRGSVQARRYESVSVLFTDFKDFTRIAEQLSPEQLVADIDRCFRAFDAILERYPVEKIKTIGDSYMCAAGLPKPDTRHAQMLVQVGLEMQNFMQHHNAERRAQGQQEFPMRVGIHSGPVVAGVVGVRKFAYDIWGDTVNTAARMESSGEPGQVNISGATYSLVNGTYRCTPRGTVEAKGKEPMEMYFVHEPSAA